MRSVLAFLLFAIHYAVVAAPTARRHTGHQGEKAEHKHGLAVKAHGTLLTLAFSFLYPAGVALIRGGFQRGFVLHWVTQAGTTTAALAGMIIMIVKTWGGLVVSCYSFPFSIKMNHIGSYMYHFVLYRQLLTMIRRLERRASTTTLALRSSSSYVCKFC
jgi:hypothetical protein